jgi:hypothetical protein
MRTKRSQWSAQNQNYSLKEDSPDATNESTGRWERSAAGFKLEQTTDDDRTTLPDIQSGWISFEEPFSKVESSPGFASMEPDKFLPRRPRMERFESPIIAFLIQHGELVQTSVTKEGHEEMAFGHLLS